MKAAEFAGKNVYIVGGSMGIGLAIAKRVAALGAHVTLFARRSQPLERAAQEVAGMRQAPSQAISWRQLDVTDPERVSQVMAATVAEVGPPDVLINCAGRAAPAHFENISYEQFAETLRINLHGCWNTVRALLPHMRGRGGYIVNTASVAGIVGVFGYTDYCASKFGLVGFSEALRSELKPHHITVSVLCPPDTDTPGFEEENKTKPAETWAIAASTKIMRPETVADGLIRGMRKRSFLIVPGVESKLAVLAKRLLPGLVEHMMDRSIRRVAQRRSLGKRP